MAGYFLSYSLRTVNAVIAPGLSAEIRLDAADLGLLSSAYFLAFALAQLPLGLLLDRHGPRRVESALLLVATVGCALFASAHSVAGLTIARALIGLGVSACLMAAFKSFSQWYPAERQASLTGLVMAAGGCGAIMTSAPLEHALPWLGWRGALYGLAAACVVVAAIIAWLVPERPAIRAAGSLRSQVIDVLRIARTPIFWRYAPHSLLVVGGFMAVQGLWAVPWMMQVTGVDRALAARHLFVFNCALLLGQLLIATLATAVQRRGIAITRLIAHGIGAGLLAEACIVFELAPALPAWFVFGLAMSTGALMYASLASAFPIQLYGRVTTLINLFAFIGAFSVQWGFGAMVDLLRALGSTVPDAYRTTYGGLWALQAAAWIWFLRRSPTSIPRQGAPR